jgi:hypothetical protein
MTCDHSPRTRLACANATARYCATRKVSAPDVRLMCARAPGRNDAVTGRSPARNLAVYIHPDATAPSSGLPGGAFPAQILPALRGGTWEGN